MKRCDINIKKAIELSEQMIRLANRGDEDREDIGCGVLYGILRDAGYKIRKLAEEEKIAHMAKGWWNET
jgi:hypothetical protein